MTDDRFSRRPPGSTTLPPAPSAADALTAAMQHARFRRSSIPPRGSIPPVLGGSSTPAPAPTAPVLPTPPPGARLSSRPPGRVTPVPGRPTVLVVADEDAPRIAGTLGEVSKIALAVDAAEAKIALSREVPSAIVIDAAALGWSSIELVRAIRVDPDTARVPVFFLGSDDPALVVAAINTGVRAVLGRPLDVTDLKERVRAALRGR